MRAANGCGELSNKDVRCEQERVLRKSNMRRVGLVELVRRAATLALLVIAAEVTFADLRAPSWLYGSAWALAAGAVYLLIPRPSIPENALRHEVMPSTIMPDILGFLLGVTFFALPLVMISNDPTVAGIWIIPLISWLLGLSALAILFIAARYACSWVILREDGMTIASLWRIDDLAFDDIARVRAVERRLPAWVGMALVIVGGWRGAGVALLHANRGSHALVFERKSGAAVNVSVDAFPGLDRVISSLRRAGVPLDGMVA